MALEVGVHAYKGLGRNVPRDIPESLQQITKDSLDSKSVQGRSGSLRKVGLHSGHPKTIHFILRGGVLNLQRRSLSPFQNE